ncbi:hypothetical protein M9H77_18919 [Catharanthus roseus]|uniref:Uncharacterized protein n=1 Tax=Catharanthus roseus TaxID=4058 RepID=A0ACC0B8U8_CATRO|nr:hypothetical protein M9H77_18919 [Catharanthus roseus]
MSNDNIGNVDNDMVEESHAHRIKKDAYYVASTDGPGLILTTVQLKETEKDNNYAEWARAMRMALRSKKNAIYGTVRSHMIQQEPMPKLRTILAQICKEEQHKNLTRAVDHTSDGAAFASPAPEQNAEDFHQNFIAHIARELVMKSPAASNWWATQNGSRRTILKPQPPVVKLHREITVDGAAADLDAVDGSS